jgi:methylated-DNA-protein-cysteine methyltransferase-like protein
VGSAGTWDEVWEVVRQIPAGRVIAYGGVARLLTRPLPARAVGWALHDCPDDVPWHRVVNVRGECSTDRIEGAEIGRQRRLLESEGVEFVAGRVDMKRFAWDPESGA